MGALGKRLPDIMAEVVGIEKGGGRFGEHGLLFEYIVKVLLIAGLLELILYRLASRLGMHFSKMAQEHEWVRWLFLGLSNVGFFLLNLVSLLVFLALFLLLLNKMRQVGVGPFDGILIPSLSFLVVLTVVFLVFPPAMMGSVVYNSLAWLVLLVLSVELVLTHRGWIQRVTILTFALGVSGWLYYQTVSTAYGIFNLGAAPPLVHEAHRIGEGLMVLASFLVFWAFGAPTFWTRNRRQRHRMLWFVASAGIVFLSLLFMDYLVGRYDPSVADTVRKAGQGIGWIFQMGMGYTFYLPFAFYVTGLLCWGFTVMKLISMGRTAGYGIGFMFIAGFALNITHLTLMVVLGLMLVALDRRGVAVQAVAPVEHEPVVPSPAPVWGSHS